VISFGTLLKSEMAPGIGLEAGGWPAFAASTRRLSHALQ
jgi:hypothetical protein